MSSIVRRARNLPRNAEKPKKNFSKETNINENFR